jgi:hypothetical protein
MDNLGFNWLQAKALPWRQRNAAVEAATRTYLGRVPEGTVLSTWDLAAKLLPFKAELEDARRLSQLLSRMAPYVKPLATHDGETIVRYGRRWKRWQWHGQLKSG